MNKTDSDMKKINSRLAKRADRWVNSTNKFGGSRDPITQTSYEYDNILGRGQIDALYEHDWLARRVVEIPAKDATREWIELTHDTDAKKAELIRDELERLNVREMVEEAIRLGRLYGGDLLVIGAFDGREMHEPLGPIRSVEFMHNVDRYLTYPQTYYTDPSQMNYGSPETYLVQRLQVHGALTTTVHESRVIRFEGNYLPPVRRMRNFGWSETVLQNFYEALRDFGVSIQSASAVLQDFITKKVKVSNLVDLLTTEDGEQQLMSRMALLAYGMSVHNIAVFGADEEFDKMGTPINNLSDLLNFFVDFVSAAAEIPKARLFHNQTGVLGGDPGANDLRVHYDNIAAYQENKLRAKIRRIIDLIGEPHGIKPGEVDFTFKQLWQLSEKDNADIYLKTAQADQIYINSNVVEPEEVALSRFSGDGINVNDMVINTERREEYLEELAKQPIDLDETEPDGDEGTPAQGTEVDPGAQPEPGTEGDPGAGPGVISTKVQQSEQDK